jgi:hypothetical protein
MGLFSRLFGTSTNDALVDRVAAELGMQRAGHELIGQRHGVTVGAQRQDGCWRIYGRMSPPLDLGLVMHRRGASPPDVARGELLRAAHPGLNMTYLLYGDEHWRIGALLTDALGTAIIERFGAHAEMVLTDHGVTVTLSDDELREHPLARTTDSIAQVTALLEQQRVHVPVASSLGEHHAAWQQFAAQRRLTATTAPLGLRGPADAAGGGAAELSAHAVRIAPGRFAMDVTLRLLEPLALGLDVRPRAAVDTLSAMFGGEEGKLDDAPFDAAFVTRAADIERARELLDARARELLASMQRRTGSLALTDDGVTVRQPSVPTDPSVVLTAVDEAIQLAAHIEARRRASMSRGAYR